MAPFLTEGTFDDDGILPARVVRRCGYGGLVATVAQGQPELDLWAGLACIQSMRKERVNVTLGKGIRARAAGVGVLKCLVVDCGAGFKDGPATCTGNSGQRFEGHVTTHAGKVEEIKESPNGKSAAG